MCARAILFNSRICFGLIFRLSRVFTRCKIRGGWGQKALKLSVFSFVLSSSGCEVGAVVGRSSFNFGRKTEKV